VPEEGRFRTSHQLAATETLIAQRREQYRQRSRRELGEDNIWIRHEITSLQAIIDSTRAVSAAADHC
jgi:hypothetical protein